MQSKNQKVGSLLGLAQRAGKIVSGEDTVQREVAKGKVYLLIVAADSSENTKKQAEKWSIHHQVPIRYCFDRGYLGNAIGKEWRAIIGVKDRGFSKELQRYIDEIAE